MQKISDKALFKTCGECHHCFDAYTGEYDKPFGITPEDYKSPQCSNLPMDYCFPEVDVNKIRVDCPLRDCEVFENSEVINFFKFLTNTPDDELLKFYKIILVKKHVEKNENNGGGE